MKNAVIAIRVSDEDQVDGFSLEAQEAECERWCEQFGYEVAERFVGEGESAKKAKRKQLMAVLNYCEKHKAEIDALVVTKLDRWARNNEEYWLAKSKLRACGIQIFSVREQFDDSPSGRFMEGILATAAQYENDRRSENVKDGMEAAAKQGWWLWPAPLGYRIAKVPHGAKDRTTLEHDPDVAPVVRRAYELYASGSHNMAEIARLLYPQGLRTKTGKPLSYQSMRNLLSKPAYAGFVSSSLTDGEMVKGRWTPIVDPVLFDRVQLRLADNAGLAPVMPEDERFPLRGLIQCANCGKPLSSSLSKGKTRRYAYYQCKCESAVRAQVAHVEDWLREILEPLTWSEEYERFFRANALKSAKAAFSQERGSVEQARLKLKRLEDRRDRLVEMRLSGEVDEDLYRRKNEQVMTDMRRARLEVEDSDRQAWDVRTSIDYLCEIFRTPWKFFKALKKPQKEAFFELVFPEGLYLSKTGFRTPLKLSPICHLGTHGAEVSSLVHRRGVEPLTS